MVEASPMTGEPATSPDGPSGVHAAAASPAVPATLVLIASAGHSGSTLLDLLLGNHSMVSSAGEMNRLSLHAPDRVCACGATVTACPYWNQVRGAITRTRRRTGLIRWDECHTDIPPQKPRLQLEMRDTPELCDGVLPPVLRTRLAAAGLRVGDGAVLTRGGVRDFKWRLTDPASQLHYVLRVSEQGVDVYDEAVTWKNPLRLVPEPLEVALALGRRSALTLLRAWSASAAEYAAVAENSWAVADAMAAVSGRRFVVDSSKSPVRLKLMYLLRPERVRIVQLVRDGRAVTASAMRRRDMSAAMAARIWKRDNQNLTVMLGSVPARQKIEVRYEALCDDPASEVKRVCDFLGLDFEAGMLTLWQRPVHNIPGNPMLFNRSRRAISKDERWRRDLTEGDLEAFNRTAGRLNRAFGYR
jgi:hypothetical protein